LTIFLCGSTPFLTRCIVIAPCHPNLPWISMIYASNHSKCARWECRKAFCTTFLNKILVTHIVMLIAMTKNFRDPSMLVESAGPRFSSMNHEMNSTSCYSICPSQSSNFELVWLFFLFWTLDNVWFMTHLLTCIFISYSVFWRWTMTFHRVINCLPRKGDMCKAMKDEKWFLMLAVQKNYCILSYLVCPRPYYCFPKTSGWSPNTFCNHSMACYGYVYDMLGSMLYTTCLACLHPLVLLTCPKDP
jgi:hypothetical protein